MNSHRKEQATLRATLDEAIESGVTTRKAIGIAAGADDEMVRRWLSGQMPKLNRFRALISGCLIPGALQDAVVDWFLRTTNYRAVRATAIDRTVLDHDANGIVDANDTLSFGIAALAKGAEAMDEIVSRARNGKLNEADKATVLAVLYDQKAHIEKQIMTIHEPPVRLASA